MKLAEQSASTRKHSASIEQRRQKRREKWPIVSGYGPVDVDGLGGSAAIVTSAARGGLYLEHEEEGTFHAVPIEAAAALGFTDPQPQSGKAPEAKPAASKK